MPPSLLHAFNTASELVAGVTFAVGLGLSGMTHPAKVAAFLSLTHRAWDPSLAAVMGAGVVMSMVGYHVAGASKRVHKPLLGGEFAWPTTTHLDRRLLIGKMRLVWLVPAPRQACGKGKGGRR